jgi:PTH1 family peptidyl-tRNA hydrolase
LGNPGDEYAGTRHNIGFRVLERLAKQWSAGRPEKNKVAEVREARCHGEPVLLVRPATFMNASGKAVKFLMEQRQLSQESMLVVCDDLALPLGMIRIRPEGSSGGQMGLVSIAEAIATEQFARLRVGIGSGPDSVRGDLIPKVLGIFSRSEEAALETGLTQAEEACAVWVAQGISTAMNRFNRKVTES